MRKRNYFEKYGDTARAVLDALLDKYADAGIEDLEDVKVLQLHPLEELGTPVELIKSFGGKSGYAEAVKELESYLYSSQTTVIGG